MYGSDLIQQFEASLRAANRAQRTIGQYTRILAKLGRFLFARNQALLTATTQDIEDWQKEWTDRAHLADASQRALIDAAHAFYRWALDRELIIRDPAAKIRFFCRAPLPRVPDFNAILALVASIDISEPQGIRDRALIMFLFGSGLRITEALSIRMVDINVSTGQFRVMTKGNRERIHVVGPEASAELGNWVKERPNWDPRCDSLWISRAGDALPSNAVRKMLIRRQKACDITEVYKYASGISRATITPHSLRHAYATELYRAGTDLPTLKDLLGHQRITTTMVYVHMDQAKTRLAIHALPTLLPASLPPDAANHLRFPNQKVA